MIITESRVALAASATHLRQISEEAGFDIHYQSLLATASTDPPEDSQFSNTRLRLALRLMQLLFSSAAPKQDQQAANLVAEGGNKQPVEPRAARVVLSFHRVVTETESACFSACGQVKTADGRSFDFQHEIQLERRTRTETEGESELNLVDPLVLNFSAVSASLSGTSFSFDLNADGKPENINQLNHDSAFLALDSNVDGKIGDGSELFGALSGDGFADLAKYDDDHNGWIDETDAVFSRLKLWQPDAEHGDALLDLAEREVGAIYLGQARADFSLQNPQQEVRGQLRASGVYLKESGMAGSIQQIDLAA